MMAGWMPGLFAEGVEGLRLEDVSIAFDASKRQGYWGSVCVNTTAAGFPVTTVGGSCVLPPPP